MRTRPAGHTQRDQVTGEKLFLFLREKVWNRPVKRKAKAKHVAKKPAPKRLQANGSGGGEEDASSAESDDEDSNVDEEAAGKDTAEKGVVKTIGWTSLKAYASAIIDPYTQQANARVNAAPHPRSAAVKQLIETARKQQQGKDRREYKDRAHGTHLDGYDRDEMRKLSAYFFERDTEIGMRDRAALFLCHFALLRGDNCRALEFPDLHHLELRDEGFTPCFAVVLILRQGKTNKFGHLEFGSFIRAADVELCPVGALALYLFSRFQLSREPFPDFSSSSAWYDRKVIKSPSSLVAQLEYRTHSSAVKQAFKACNIVSTAATHSSRKSGAQMAEADGAPEAAVRRAGRWNQQTMESCFLSKIPRQVLRAHAGFSTEGGTFHLPRAQQVPEALLDLVFPQAKDWLRQLEAGKQDNNGPVDKSIAARGFLRLLLQLREVVCQDAVALRQKFPSSYLWNAAVFASPQLLAFEKSFLQTLQTQERPAEQQLRVALPLLADKITNSHNSLLQMVQEQSATLRDQLR
ncbi:hypothetical protein A4X09_0g5909 [Tilletia walkeri]|uniref:Ndc10 domain-containing protein n=1 Tax=Tilletia walkeri TaxID=117179 RepID=A0A8X7N6J5_9BASI|nr:hypothetical protein A4X09_0g5909 [Tilletia walkeri]